MKVVLVSASDRSGGAARAAWRLRLALDQAGVDATLLARWVSERTAGVLPVEGSAARLHRRTVPRLERALRRWTGVPSSRSRSYNVAPTRLHPTIHRLEPDVAHIHWVGHGAMTPGDIGRLRVPVVLTLHDAWLLHGVRHLPEVGPTTARDERMERLLLARKLRRLPGAVTIVTPSRWLASLAVLARPTDAWQVEVVPNALDTEYFRPANRGEARARFGLSADAVLIGIAAADLTDPIKGLRAMVDVLDGLELPPVPEVAVVAIGAGNLGSSRLSVHHVGHLPEEEVAALLPAMDLVVVPSTSDNLPQVATEAQSCGLPVITTTAGGCPETVEHDRTGLVVEVGDGPALGSAVARLVQDRELRLAMGAAGRDRAVRLWSPEVVAARHIEIYHQAIERHRPGQGRPA